MSEILKDLLEILNRFGKVDGNDDLLLWMVLQRFNGKISKEIDLARLDDLKTARDARHGLSRIGAKAHLRRMFIERNSFLEKFDSALDDFHAFDIPLRLECIALVNLDGNRRRQHRRGAMLFEHILKESLDLGNQSRIGSVAHRRSLDGPGCSAIKSIALLLNFLQTDPVHLLALKVESSENV